MDFMKMLREEREKARSQSQQRQPLTSSPMNPSESIVADSQHTSSPLSTDLEKDRLLLQSMKYEYVDICLPCITEKDKYKVGSIPTMFYFPNVISSEDETKIMNNVNKYDKNWTKLRGRRLQCWGGNPDGSPSSDMFSILSPWLLQICSSLVECGVFDESNRPNHVLINQYNGDEGIIHHTDGPKYLNCVAILSLQSARLMTFRKRLQSDEVGVKYGGDLFSVCLQPRSLLIFMDDLYIDYLHGLSDAKEFDIVDDDGVECLNKCLAGVASEDRILREKRTSLTIRKIFS